MAFSSSFNFVAVAFAVVVCCVHAQTFTLVEEATQAEVAFQVSVAFSAHAITSRVKSGIKAYRVTYPIQYAAGGKVVSQATGNFPDLSGETMSGLLVVPDPLPDTMDAYVWAHGTTLETAAFPSNGMSNCAPSQATKGLCLPKSETASSTYGAITIAGTLDRAVIIPDGLGNGDSTLPPTYLIAEAYTVSFVNMYLAAKDYITDTLSSSLNDDIYIGGLSEGGYASVAMQMGAEKAEWKRRLGDATVKATYSTAVAAELDGTLMATIYDMGAAYPAATLYILLSKSYEDFLGIEVSNPKYTQFLTDLVNGTNDFTVVETALRTEAAKEGLDSPIGFLSDSFLASLQAIQDGQETSHPFIDELKKNSLISDNAWENGGPQATIYSCYGTADDIVISAVSKEFTDKFPDKVEELVYPASECEGHGGCMPLCWEEQIKRMLGIPTDGPVETLSTEEPTITTTLTSTTTTILLQGSDSATSMQSGVFLSAMVVVVLAFFM